MVRVYLRGIGLLMGMTIGAGIFALPYIFSKAGFFWGIFHFAFTGLILLYLHLLYGEICYFTEERHRFPGQVTIFLGKRSGQFAFLTTIASYYGTFLVYGLLGGLFLFNIFGQFSPLSFSLFFFAVSAVFSLFNLNKIASINFYLTVPLVFFIVYLLFFSWPVINFENFQINLDWNHLKNSSWFLPYGAWLFALSGFSAIPEVRDIFYKRPLKTLRRGVFWGFIVSSFISFIFVATVFGVSGFNTAPDGLSGLVSALGKTAIFIGSIIGFLAVFTSQISLAADLKFLFKFDYKITTFFSWTWTVVPPIALFLLGASDFVKIIDLTGTLGMGVLGLFIILMARKLRKKFIEHKEFLLSNPILENFVLVAVIAGVTYELWKIFFL